MRRHNDSYKLGMTEIETGFVLLNGLCLETRLILDGTSVLWALSLVPFVELFSST